MKEARIIFAGGDEEMVNHFLKLIARRFGGFTNWTANGGWVNGDDKLVQEPVRVVDVALDYPQAIGYLRSLARIWAAMADEECVYLRDTEGNVELVEVVERPSIE
jgi:hypothetical protein